MQHPCNLVVAGIPALRVAAPPLCHRLSHGTHQLGHLGVALGAATPCAYPCVYVYELPARFNVLALKVSNSRAMGT